MQQEMLEEALELLNSPRAGDRMRGWSDLLANFISHKIELTLDGTIPFVHLLRAEPDEMAWRYGNGVIQEISMRLFSGTGQMPPVDPRRRTPNWLADWLWNPFLEVSAVFGTAADKNLRDGAALVVLSRRLGYREFGATRIEFVPLGSPYWHDLYKQHPGAVCLVGRLSLFGTDAISRWGHEKARFAFPTYDRPAGAAPHTIDQEYHCIIERRADGRIEEHHSSEQDGKRIDFAVVQRYTVPYSGGRRIVVVQIAGASSLGTLGAAEWAAYELYQPARPDGDPIPCAPGIASDSALEALLKVTADASSGIWAPWRVDLCKLYAADHRWCSDEGRWTRERLPIITIVCEDGNPRKPLSVLFDGAPRDMVPGKETFHLLVGLCLLAQKDPNGRVSLAELAQDRWVWSGNTVSAKQVRSKLPGLKNRFLPDALVIDKSNQKDVYLRAHVVIASDGDNLDDAGGPAAPTPKPR